ncbi:MAG: LUD domain-containing protein [Methanobacteriota archaeon]|nr:MAG: LUD domain-containing protein [Euryarchaeota archaeon]
MRSRVSEAVRGTSSLDGMRRSFRTIIDRRLRSVERLPDLESKRDVLRELKERCVGNEDLLRDAMASLRENGCRVLLAKDSDAAVRAVVVELEGERMVVKSKSNVTKEVGLAAALEREGFEVVETDLGDRVVQIAGCEAVHPTGPACHLTRKQISELLSQQLGKPVSEDPVELTAAVRDEISEHLDRAQVGVTGANAITAREGAIVIAHNEGNAARCASLPGKHIVLTTPDKVVPSLNDAVDVVGMQTLYSTGKIVTAYIDVVTGPSYTADIEKQVFRGMHGPKEVVVVFVDNGRLGAETREPMYCIGCGSCITRCPVYDIVGPLFGAHGHLGGQGAYLLSSLGKHESAQDAGLYMCTSCGECEEACPVRIDTKGGLLRARAEPSARALGLDAEHSAVVASVRNYDNPWQMPRARKSRWSKGIALPSKGDTLYYGGCSTSYLFPESAQRAVRLMRAAGVQPGFIGSGEPCCGSTVRKLGDVELAREKAEECFAAFAAAGATMIVTSCPGCFSMLDSHDDLKARHGLRIQHLSQWLAERIGCLQLEPVRSLGGVTYHDPCDLGRDCGVFDEPRRLVRAAVGDELLEMARSRSESACCGAGSGIKSGFPDLASAIARRRIEHANEAGADTIVTACPWCLQNLRDSQTGASPVPVMDLWELLDEALGASEGD